MNQIIHIQMLKLYSDIYKRIKASDREKSKTKY